MNKTILADNQISEYVNTFRYEDPEGSQQKELQITLSKFYKNILSKPLNFKNIPDNLTEYKHIRDIEDAWNIYEEDKIMHMSLPQRKSEFGEWYLEVNLKHKQEVKPFFNYLAHKATLEELGFYICLEEKVDGSFDDMIALAQLGVQGKAKMIMAENYWDEMGNGHEHLVHTTMFAASADYMKNLFKDKHIDLGSFLPTAALKNGNILMMYGLRRRYIPRLLGAIGILEDTASERFQSTVQGLERFNLPQEVVQYHRAHIHIDSKHGEEWLKHVLLPSVREGGKDYMIEICKGMLIRFNIAINYYNAIERSIKLLKNHFFDSAQLDNRRAEYA